MPSPFIPGRLRELRAEAGLSQAELAQKIGSDARQVGQPLRERQGRLQPRSRRPDRRDLQHHPRLPAHPRRPQKAPPLPRRPIDARLADLGQLTDDERATIANVIDAITTRARLRLITGNAS